MYNHFETHLKKYKDFFPKNRPQGGLDNTILMLRLIHRNHTFAATHPEFHSSFTQHLKNMLSVTAIDRYQKFKELTSPFDENDGEAILEGLNKLADMIKDDIDTDFQHFRKPFAR